MAALPELIDKLDTFEIVRDEVAAILLLETTQQQALAVATLPTPRDPYPWAFRVFTERMNPWGEFLDLPTDTGPLPILPLVNVWWSGITFDKSASNVVERQKGTSTINVDCYAYATSEDILGGGHKPGDENAQRAVQRVVRLVRNILMAGQYTYLGLQGTVWTRWIHGIEIFEPPVDVRSAQRIGAARITLHVDHSEFSPQVGGVPLELISTTVERGDTGQIYFTADHP
jgi:hypothetical protein